MARTQRLSTTGALIVCLVGTQWSGTLFASEATSAAPAAAIAVGQQPGSTTALSSAPPSTRERSPFAVDDEVLMANAPAAAAGAQPWRGQFDFIPSQSSSFAQRGPFRGRGGRNGAAAAIVVGAVATITGAALLVYANRPECSTNQTASGCGYGTKVVGGAVLSAGAVGLVVGALTWR